MTHYTVYQITEGDELVYVGLTKTPRQRAKDHAKRWPDGVFTPLVLCDRKYAQWLERALIKAWAPRDNVHPGGVWSPGPVSPSDATRKRMSEAASRRMTPEVRAKISAALKGRKLSDETKAKMSAVRKGRKLSAEHSAKISAGLTGRKLSAEHIAKSAAARKGKKRGPRIPHTEETKAKISAALTGKTLSAATRKKISEAARRRREAAKE